MAQAAQTAQTANDQQRTVRIAATLAVSATLVLYAGGKTSLDSSLALAALAPIALSALTYLAGAFAATAVTGLSRRPILGAAALTGLGPFAPILPAPENWALFAAFLIFGLLTASSLRAAVAAFARERLASLGGALGLGLIAAIAAAAGLAESPLMQIVLALSGIVACLAVASVVATVPATAR